MEVLLLAAVLGVGIFVGPAFISGVFQRPAVGYLLVLICGFGRAIGIKDELFSIGNISFFPYDLAFGILGGVAFTKILLRGTVNRIELAWLGLFGFSAVAFLRGVEAFGLAYAGEIRGSVYIIIAVLYCMTAEVRKSDLNDIAKLWIVVAILLSAVAVINLGTGGIIAGAVVREGLDTRVLHAVFALQIFQATLISLYLWAIPGTGNIWRYAGLGMLPIVILLQYRTVWVVALISVLLLVSQEWKHRAQTVLITGAAVAVSGVFVLLIVSGLAESTHQSLIQAVLEPLGSNSTFHWRVEGWTYILEEQVRLNADLFIGPPAGTGRSLEVISFRFAHPHSGYFVVLLRNGLIGVAVVFGTYYFAIRHLRQSGAPAPGEMLSGRILFLLLATQLLFFITYDASYEQFLLLGTAVSFLVRQKASVVRVPKPDNGIIPARDI
jgi:hypothetical protein